MLLKMDYHVYLKMDMSRIMKGTWKIRVLHVKDIPLTYEGKAIHNIQ